MKAVLSKSIKKPVIFMKIIEDGRLVVIDNETTVRFFDTDDLKLVGGFKAGVLHKHYTTPVVDFSNDAKFFALISADEKESRLFNTKSKKLVAKVSRHQGHVSAVAIDPLSRYMFSAGEDGKTFAIDVESGKLVFTLPPHADTINDIAFSQNGNWVGVASYDRKISLYSMVTMTPKEKLKAHSAPVMKLTFFQKNKLLSIDKNSSAIIWDVYTSKVLKRLEGIHDDVTAIVVGIEEQVVFLGTKLGYVLVYDLKNYEQISSKFIKLNTAVLSLNINYERQYLIIGTEDGNILYYDIFQGLSTFKESLSKKDFSLVSGLLDRNPLLKYTQVYDLMSNFWEKSFAKAKEYLEKENVEKAKLLLQHFKSVPGKSKLIQKLFRDYAEFPKFLKYVQENRLGLAYSLANQYPVYKETEVFKQLEKRWKKDIATAQKYVLNAKTMQSAKEILAPYRGIAEKTMYVQDVLTKENIYRRFKDAIKHHEFHLVFGLIKQHAFLKELPEYTMLMEYADSLYIKIQKLVEGKNFAAAIQYLEILQDFEGFKEDAQQQMQHLEIREKFFKSIKLKDFITAYQLLEKDETLIETKEGSELFQRWNSDEKRAKYFAARGDVGEMRKVLQSYETIPAKYPALATLYAFAAMMQLEDALKQQKTSAEIEKGIKNYVQDFGLTEQIEEFFNIYKEKYPTTKLDLELLKKGSFTLWKPSKIRESILE